MKTTKTKKPLKLKDTESVAGLFADDLVKYFRMGGDMKNLTAQKVYTKLRGSDEKVYYHADLLSDIESTKAEVKEVLGNYPATESRVMKILTLCSTSTSLTTTTTSLWKN